ncbi:class I SAM-dependent methyltransferase [Chloroflexia bacterium SDU3-3]|nr:class I SAM-dependent methyltransferase [Chloroflexia bacterium SDU3-3]
MIAASVCEEHQTMTDRSFSKTAFGAAYIRAAHQKLDRPLILEDSVIGPLLLAMESRPSLDPSQVYQLPNWDAIRSRIALRSRYAEDRLAESLGRGVAQYVLLGAGLDTFAYRQPAWATALRIFEVDQPATQQVKRGLLAKAGIALPPNLSFVQADFERQTLGEILGGQGVDAGLPTFFSWLGVAVYLHEEAIDAVLRTVATYPAGSEIVLTYNQPTDAPSPLAQRTADAGEPWVSAFTPEQMEAKLRGAGFSQVHFFTPEEAARRYYQGHALPVPNPTMLVAAVV